MGRSPCCNDDGLKKGPWMPEEDQKLIDYIQRHGHGSWRALPKLAGLNRCGKSCRLRWTNYLRPDIKRGQFSEEEKQIIIQLHSVLGNKWSAIAANLPGRTDNEIKNFWNTHLRKKLLQMGIDPITHRPRTDLNLLTNLSQLLATANICNLMNPWDNALRLQTDVAQVAKIQLLNLLQVINSSSSAPPNMEAVNLLGSTGLHYNPLDPAPNPTQILSSFSNLGVPQPPNGCQIIADPCVGFEGGPISNVLYNDSCNLNNNSSSSYAIPTENPIPASVSASPECSTDDQMESKIIPFDISAPSSTLTTFEDWGELNLTDETSDYFWTDIIE